MGAADWVGIDAPFGWPDAFVEAIAGYAARRRWPGPDRGPLRLRATDRFVRESTGLTPMSVSSDRIGATAMRCVLVLVRLGDSRGAPIDLAGGDRVVETYPAAALRVWADDAPAGALVWSGYKGREGRAKRGAITATLEREVPLTLGADERTLCVDNDDALDALLCALIARAAERGLTRQPSGDLQEAARSEGWIHVPADGSLRALTQA